MTEHPTPPEDSSWDTAPPDPSGGWGGAPSGRQELKTREPSALDHADLSPKRVMAASAVAVAAGTVFIGVLGIPAATALTVGGTFVGITVAARVLSVLGDDRPGLIGRLANWSEKLWTEWGTGFYGMASLTSFVVREGGSLSDVDFTLDEFLSDPIGNAISWGITQMIEGIMNAVWSALWWIDMIGFANTYGMYVAGGAVFAGWLFWSLLRFDEPDDPILEGEFRTDA